MEIMILLVFVFLAAVWGARLGTREALKQFKEEVIKELYENQPHSSKVTARDVLNLIRDELLHELRGGTPPKDNE